MNKTIVFFEDAGRVFLKLPENIQESLTRKLFFYGLTGQGDVKKLVGRNGLRLRDGDYRVIFEERERPCRSCLSDIAVRFIAEGGGT